MINVRVPATSANMGAGFDSLGIALDIYSRLWIEERERGLEIVTVHNAGAVRSDESNLIYRAMERVFKETGYFPKGLYIKQDSRIPMTRGLGSSSACIVGGMLAANIICGRRLGYDDILNMASDMEGHPDNAAPALYGGFCTAVRDRGRVLVKSAKLVHKMKFAVMIPDFFVATKRSRGALPALVRFEDAVHNISSALLFRDALISGDFELLRRGVDDRLHQPYRKNYIDGFEDIFEMTYRCGSKATWLSGSGPTIISVLTDGGRDFKAEMERFFSENAHNWSCLMLECDNVGSVVSVT